MRNEYDNDDLFVVCAVCCELFGFVLEISRFDFFFCLSVSFVLNTIFMSKKFRGTRKVFPLCLFLCREKKISNNIKIGELKTINVRGVNVNWSKGVFNGIFRWFSCRFSFSMDFEFGGQLCSAK